MYIVRATTRGLIVKTRLKIDKPSNEIVMLHFEQAGLLSQSDVMPHILEFHRYRGGKRNEITFVLDDTFSSTLLQLFPFIYTNFLVFEL